MAGEQEDLFCTNHTPIGQGSATPVEGSQPDLMDMAQDGADIARMQPGTRPAAWDTWMTALRSAHATRTWSDDLWPLAHRLTLGGLAAAVDDLLEQEAWPVLAFWYQHAHTEPKSHMAVGSWWAHAWSQVVSGHHMAAFEAMFRMDIDHIVHCAQNPQNDWAAQAVMISPTSCYAIDAVVRTSDTLALWQTAMTILQECMDKALNGPEPENELVRHNLANLVHMAHSHAAMTGRGDLVADILKRLPTTKVPLHAAQFICWTLSLGGQKGTPYVWEAVCAAGAQDAVVDVFVRDLAFVMGEDAAQAPGCVVADTGQTMELLALEWLLSRRLAEPDPTARSLLCGWEQWPCSVTAAAPHVMAWLQREALGDAVGGHECERVRRLM